MSKMSNKKDSLLLLVSKVSVEYKKGKKILDNVSFEVGRGELISLIGLNGTGKTTLLKTIVGLIKPNSGKIISNAEKMFYIPQKSDLDTSFPLTVKEFCELFGDKDYEDFLLETGMEKFLDSKVASLSGGQFQRILIAVALSKKPDLLLLDEPTTGIDVAGEQSFYKLISDLKKKYEISMILVSHDIHLVMKNTDKVLCISRHVCCQGTPSEVESSKEFQEIFGNHLTPYVHKHDHVH